MRYSVTIYFSEVYEVEADNEAEARSKADEKFNNLNVLPIPDEYEIECLDDEEEEQEE